MTFRGRRMSERWTEETAAPYVQQWLDSAPWSLRDQAKRFGADYVPPTNDTVWVVMHIDCPPLGIYRDVERAKECARGQTSWRSYRDPEAPPKVYGPEIIEYEMDRLVPPRGD